LKPLVPLLTLAKAALFELSVYLLMRHITRA
jgi:hypothetical protein